MAVSLSTPKIQGPIMLCMRTLTYEYRLPGRSCAEVYEALEDALTAHQRGRTVLFRGRKLTTEALLNAVLLHFTGLDFATQRAILEREVPRLEALLAADPLGPQAPSGPRIIGVRHLGDELPPDDPQPQGKRAKRQKPPAQ